MAGGVPPEAPRVRIGARLREARHGAGLSQAQAARALRLAQTSVSALERGRYLPDEPTWSRLTEVYDLDADEAATLWAEVRAARRLRGAAAGAEDREAWPVDPASCSRRDWCGAVRRRHRLTRAELAARLGVSEGAAAKLEQETAALPTAVKAVAVLRELATLGGADERALRSAWQPDEVAGIEHLLGLDAAQVLAAAEDVVQVVRWALLVGHTQSEIADACGVSRPAVHQWLAGQTVPTTARIGALARLLDADPRAS
jgi:transcriptional regulator with XRE-family HTH domain